MFSQTRENKTQIKPVVHQMLSPDQDKDLYSKFQLNPRFVTRVNVKCLFRARDREAPKLPTLEVGSLTRRNQKAGKEKNYTECLAASRQIPLNHFQVKTINY